MTDRSVGAWPLLALNLALPVGTLAALAQRASDADWGRPWSLYAWVVVCVGVHIVSMARFVRARRALALVLIAVGMTAHLALCALLLVNASLSWTRSFEKYGPPTLPDVEPTACWSQPSSPAHAQLTTAPTRIDVGGKTLLLDAEAGRDFMPKLGPGMLRQNRLHVRAIVATVDATPLPRGVDLDLLWVVKSPTECWETPHTAETRRQYRGLSPEHMARELEARFGPRWEPGAELDVVARILVPGKRPVLIRATKVKIEAVY